MNWKPIIFTGILGCLAWGLATPARGQGGADAELDKEFFAEYRYAEKLQNELMPDLAGILVARLRTKFTARRHVALLEALDINTLVSSAKFDEALAVIARQENQDSFTTWRMKLSIANGYYRFNRFDEFQKIHQDFLKAFPKAPADEVDEYLAQCYTFTHLLLRQKRFGMEAVNAFKHLLEQPMGGDYRRQIRSQMITHMLKLADEMEDGKARLDLLAFADTENDKQFWIQDALFGQAVVAKAHIMKLMGDTKGAQEMVDTYMPRLLEIHRMLERIALEEKDPSILRDSPMPQCRYLIASMLWKQVQQLARRETRTKADDDLILDLLLGARDRPNTPRKANGALNHFINVFSLYPESQWAMDAIEEAEIIGAFRLMPSHKTVFISHSLGRISEYPGSKRISS